MAENETTTSSEVTDLSIINSAVLEEVSYPIGALLQNVYDTIPQESAEKVASVTTLEDILFGVYKDGILQQPGAKEKKKYIGKTSVFSFLQDAQDNYGKAIFGIFCPIDIDETGLEIYNPRGMEDDAADTYELFLPIEGGAAKGAYLGTFLNRKDIEDYVIVKNAGYRALVEGTEDDRTDVEKYEWRKLNKEEVNYYYTALGDTIYSSIAQRQVMTDEWLRALPIEDFDSTNTYAIANKTEIQSLFEGG